MVSARALGFAACTLLLVGQSRAWAQNQTGFELQWRAPAECPEGRQVRQEVLKLAGEHAPSSRHLRAQALIRPEEHKGWALDLTTDLDGVTGERHLAGVSCQSLSEAVTLTLALLLNPEAQIETSPAPAPAEKVTPPPSNAKEIGRPFPDPVWQVGALAGAQVGVLRDPSPWFGLSLGVAVDRFSVRLLPGFTPPQDVSSQVRPGAGGRLWVASAAALGCYAVLNGWATLAPCWGANLTALHGHGWGVLEVREATVTWASAEVGLLARLPLGRLVRLELWGFGFVPLYRSSVYLDEAGLISRPSRLGFATLAGLCVDVR